MLASSLLAMAVALAFSRSLAVRSPARVVPPAVGLNAALLAAEWGLSLGFPRAAAAVVYVHVAAVGAALVSGFWSLVSERLDPHAARQAMARVGTGASLGGLLGGALAWAVARRISVPTMLLVMAAMNALAAAALLRLARPRAGDLPSLASVQAVGTSKSLAGLRILRQVPYLRHLVIVGLGAVAEALLDYNLKAAAAAEIPRGAEMMSFFALFHTGVALLALCAQALVTRPSLQSLGLVGTVAALPGVVLVGAVSGLAAPRLLTATLARGGQAVLQGSLFRSGYELLFTAIPKHQKRPTKTIVDVAFDKLGGALGAGIVLLAVVLWPEGGARPLFAVAAACALAALVLSRRLHRGYVEALAENLRSGAVLLDLQEALDSTTRLTMLESGLLRGSAQTPALCPASELAPDPLVRATLALRWGTPHGLARPCARPPRWARAWPRTWSRCSPGTRAPRRRPRRCAPWPRASPACWWMRCSTRTSRRPSGAAWRGCWRPATRARALDGLLQGLADGDLAVRQQCALAARHLLAGGSVPPVPPEVAFEAALRELRGWLPAQDSRTADLRLDHVFTLLELVLEREPLRIAEPRRARAGGPARHRARVPRERAARACVRGAVAGAGGLGACCRAPAAAAAPGGGRRPDPLERQHDALDGSAQRSGAQRPAVASSGGRGSRTTRVW